MAPKGDKGEDEFMDVELSETATSTDASSAHMVDMIDLDAVDFQPFFTKKSGIALNYHTSDRPEHKLLMQEGFLEKSYDQEPIELTSPVKRTMHLWSSSPATSQTEEEEGILTRRHSMFLRLIAITCLVVAALHVLSSSRFLDTLLEANASP